MLTTVWKGEREYREKGVIFCTQKKMTRSLLTTDGKIAYSRYVLRPANFTSREKLFELDDANAVILERREYIIYIGSVMELKKHFFALA